MIVFISGKMRGLAGLGRARFNTAEQWLIGRGHTVLNPAKLPVGMPEEKYMPICLAMLEAADAIYMLDNWTSSEGANVEHAYAKLQGKQILYEDQV